MQRNTCVVVIRLAAIFFAVFFTGTWAFGQELMLEPVNQEFLNYLDQPERDMDAPGQYSLGDIPSPIPVEIHQINFPQDGGAVTDPKYDMRDPNLDMNFSDTLLTPVKDQGACGACWTFACMGSLEGHLKQSFGLADGSNDYSEDNAKRRHGFDWGPCSGGNFKIATAYLSRHDGPISEADDPWDPSETSEYCTTCKPTRYVDNMLWLPARAGAMDLGYIKQAILDYGPMYANFRWESASYSGSPNYTYYYSGASSTNHAIVIVGWDDNKVVAGAPGNGAFICRNSWGAAWGEAGYFYISYYDTNIAYVTLGCISDVDDASQPINKIYQYDPLGRTSAIGYGDGVDWGANVFTPDGDGDLTAVGFYTTASGTSYEVSVYDDFNGSQFSTLLASKSGTVQYAGYYTVALDSPVAITSGDSFSVVVKFDTTTAGYTFPIPLEKPVAGYASPTANAGESYVSNTGTSFSDITGTYANTNVCIKAHMEILVCDTSPSAPTLTSPTGITDQALPVYTWESNPCADYYYLLIQNQLYKTIFKQQYSAATVDNGDDTCSINPLEVLAPGGYYWLVRAQNQHGVGPNSTKMAFTVATTQVPPAAPTLNTPTGAIAETTPTFDWDTVANADLYYLIIQNSGQKSIYKKWYALADVDNGDGTCSINPGKTLPPGDYYWRVRAKNQYGTGPNSVKMAFTVSPLP